MRILMILTSIGSYYVNKMFTGAAEANKKYDFEKPLTSLVWVTSVISIIVPLSSANGNGSLPNNCGSGFQLSSAAEPLLRGNVNWLSVYQLDSRDCQECVTAAREGGASLDILSGLVAGNFSAFWLGIAITGLMGIAYWASTYIPVDMMVYSSIFAFGLVAFGMLGMGPVTIAVDSYGPVMDNAQSIYELSLIESIPNIEKEIEKDFGFKPSIDVAKQLLEENDSAGNTFKATAKPVLIGTAVVGATTMIFSLILLLK